MTRNDTTPTSPTPTTPTTTPAPWRPPTTISVGYYAARPHLPAPADSLFASACWLVARHPLVMALARRVPGAVDPEGDVLPWILAEAFEALDEHNAAWRDYETDSPAPADDGRYDAWVEAGPAPSPAVAALGVMSRTEVTRLRLLATLNNDTPVPFTVGMLHGFDTAGQAFVQDWTLAVQGR